MGYSRVYIVAPNGQRYEAEIEDNVDVYTILDELIRKLNLPEKTNDGESISYSMNLVNAHTIQEGVTISISGDKPLSSLPASQVSLRDFIVVSKSEPVPQAIAETDLRQVKSVQSFKSEHDPSRTVFVMMKFSGGDPAKDDKLERLFNTIKLELDKYGLDAVRADEKTYCATDYMWDNAQVYLEGCDYGIAVLEDVYLDEMNPNVALEYGYMLARGKPVLLLKEKSFANIRADILGKIWIEFDIDRGESVREAIQRWMVNLEILRIKG